MFEMENRGELIEKIEDLVNRKRYTERGTFYCR